MFQPAAVTVTLVTSLDALRPDLTYRIEFESDDLFETWSAQPLLQESSADNNGTVAVSISRDGRYHAFAVELTWPEFTSLLKAADSFPREESRSGSGRYPKRVLVATTSKERRISRPGAY
jgi:hypothetical protein